MQSENPCSRFRTAAQDSNPGPLNRRYEVLPLSHCVVHSYLMSAVSGVLVLVVLGLTTAVDTISRLTRIYVERHAIGPNRVW